ncbi:MAG: hypothetical protein OXG64_04045 [Chloroflexi bacterium]|nr:hypothetical protein [Chloroflexota bacterium]
MSSGSRAGAFAAVHVTRALLQKATEEAAAIQTPRQALPLQFFFHGQPVVVIAARLGLRSRRHHWADCQRPAVEAVTHELLAQAGPPPNWDRTAVPLFLEGGKGLQIGPDAATGVARRSGGASDPASSKCLAAYFESREACQRRLRQRRDFCCRRRTLDPSRWDMCKWTTTPQAGDGVVSTMDWDPDGHRKMVILAHGDGQQTHDGHLRVADVSSPRLRGNDG